MVAVWENTKVRDNWVFSRTESVAWSGGGGQLIFLLAGKGSVMVDIDIDIDSLRSKVLGVSARERVSRCSTCTTGWDRTG